MRVRTQLLHIALVLYIRTMARIGSKTCRLLNRILKNGKKIKENPVKRVFKLLKVDFCVTYCVRQIYFDERLRSRVVFDIMVLEMSTMVQVCTFWRHWWIHLFLSPYPFECHLSFLSWTQILSYCFVEGSNSLSYAVFSCILLTRAIRMLNFIRNL